MENLGEKFIWKARERRYESLVQIHGLDDLFLFLNELLMKFFYPIHHNFQI
jgi:hypothetical protein